MTLSKKLIDKENTDFNNLSEKLNDKDWMTREKSAQTLGKMGEKAIPILLKAIEDGDSKVRRDAVWLIGKIGKKPPQVVPKLIKLLEDKESQVRWRAAWALGNFSKNAKQAILALKVTLKDKDENTRTFSAEALRKIER